MGSRKASFVSTIENKTGEGMRSGIDSTFLCGWQERSSARLEEEKLRDKRVKIDWGSWVGCWDIGISDCELLEKSVPQGKSSENVMAVVNLREIGKPQFAQITHEGMIGSQRTSREKKFRLSSDGL
jgi:hypothetical protein